MNASDGTLLVSVWPSVNGLDTIFTLGLLAAIIGTPAMSWGGRGGLRRRSVTFREKEARRPTYRSTGGEE